jgi:hypothetical protein
MLTARRIGLGVIAVAAVFVYFVMEPDPPDESAVNLSPTNYSRLVETAMSDYEANDALADSAPQQQVVNGWVARDLLQIQTLAIADLLDAVTEENRSGQLVTSADPRTPALVGLAVLAICLIGITSQNGAPLDPNRGSASRVEGTEGGAEERRFS